MKLWFLVLSFIIRCHSFGTPTLRSSCESSLAIENVNAQHDKSPFSIATSTNSVFGGQIIAIELRSDYGGSFRGFFLVGEMTHVRDLGEFLYNDDEDTPFTFIDCGTGFHNAVTHSSDDLKQNIFFKWIVPENYDGIVRFR